MPFDDAKAIFPKECKVLAHGGVACRTGVEIRGDDSAHGEAAIETTGESGQGIRGCRGEEHGHGGDRQRPWRSSDGDQDQGSKACAPGSGCAFVARGAGVDVRLLGGAGWRADEVVGIRGPDLFLHLLWRLPEGDVELVLAQLLDGYRQRVLRTGVDLRARDAEGIVEAEGRGVLVDLARPLGARHSEPIAGINLAQKLVYLKVVQHLCLHLLSTP